jgi:hypothetical protein
MTPVEIPSNWDLVLEPDPMAGGVISRATLGHGTDDELVLSIVAIPGKRVDAVFYWKHVLPEKIKLPSGYEASVADISMAQISGAVDRASAIRAVEEAAIIAGWARRRA